MLVLDCEIARLSTGAGEIPGTLLESPILFWTKEVYGQLGTQTTTKTQNVQIYGHQDLNLKLTIGCDKFDLPWTMVSSM